MATSLKVAVIGAGLSGLVAARELQRENHQITVFEKSHRIGGTWVYDPRVESDPLGLDPNREIVHGSLYKSMRTNLPRALMSFTDFKFGKKMYDDPRTFPKHEEVLKYLEDFASSFKLVEFIRFNTEVTRVKIVESELVEFVVESKTGGVSLVEVFDAVVVCNGHLTQPLVATDILGIETWSRTQMHSHNYRDPQPFQDQTVVIIGGAKSALDISREIATVAKQVHISSRSSYNYKLSNPEKFNNIWEHPKVDYIDKDGTITFQDGFSTEADIILHCTGYKYHYPFLQTIGNLSVRDKRVGPLYKHVFSPQLAPRLSFVGIPDKIPPALAFEYQSRWIAQALSGKVSLPSKDEMLSDVESYYREMEEHGVPEHLTHDIRYQGDYLNWICAQLGTMVEQEIRDASKCLHYYQTTDIDGYRDSFCSTT